MAAEDHGTGRTTRMLVRAAKSLEEHGNVLYIVAFGEEIGGARARAHTVGLTDLASRPQYFTTASAVSSLGDFTFYGRQDLPVYVDHAADMSRLGWPLWSSMWKMLERAELTGSIIVLV